MCLGIPGQVVAIEDRDAMIGVAEVCGVRRRVDLTCVAGPEGPDDALGAWVLIHVGFALSRIDEAEAAATLKALEDLGEAMEAVEAMRASDAALEGTP